MMRKTGKKYEYGTCTVCKKYGISYIEISIFALHSLNPNVGEQKMSQIANISRIVYLTEQKKKFFRSFSLNDCVKNVWETNGKMAKLRRIYQQLRKNYLILMNRVDLFFVISYIPRFCRCFRYLWNY